MSTMQDVADAAREPLNDEDKVRYTDTALLRYANAGIRRAYQVRPDLRLGSFTTPIADKTLADPFPMDEAYLQAIVDYVVFRAETRDDEHVNSNRVTVFMNSFSQALLQ